jgi:hypothetical protein
VPEPQALNRRATRLEVLCSELYQVLGTLGAPSRVLDQVLAAAEGRPLPHRTLLPFSEREGRTSAAAALGGKGGSAVSRAKARAARQNGLRGGRPRSRKAGA